MPKNQMGLEKVAEEAKVSKLVLSMLTFTSRIGSTCDLGGQKVALTPGASSCCGGTGNSSTSCCCF